MGILIGAALLGLIIAMIDDGDFPGLLPTAACVVAASAPMLIPIPFLNLVISGIVCGLAISFFTGMSVGRSWLAAGIYFFIQFALAFLIFRS